ncbi:MAG: HEAT repeat domain-containing protein [Alphaproteobacteria bacterium]
MSGPLPDEFAHTLAQKLRVDQLVLFAGAGLSMQAKARDGSGRRMPGWDALLTGIAARFGLDPANYRMDRLSLLDEVEIGHGRADLNEAVRQIIADSKFMPGDAHAALRTLPWAAVCTTNYDTVLDRCLDCQPVVTEEDFRAQMRLPRAERSKLFKLHGSLDNPHTLTTRDYKRWAGNHPLAHHFVKDLLVKNTFLFVGYSLNDPHWKALLDLVEQLVGTGEKWLYALIWQASDAELNPLRRIHQINGAGLHSDADYAAAFRQIDNALGRLGRPVAPRTVDPAAFSYDREQYARAVRRTYGYADLGAVYQWGAGFARHDVSLAEIFVPPDLLLPPAVKRIVEDKAEPGAPDQDLSELERERRRQADRLYAERKRRKPAAAVTAETDRLLIFGAPGQGKSTLLRHMLLEATERWLGDPLGAPFPCLIRLSQWMETDGAPEGRLQRYLTTHLPGFAEISRDAAEAWYAGKVLWLLDGIDEIRGAAARERFLEELTRLAAPSSRHRFVVSTRPAGEPPGGIGAEWLRTELPALAEPQVLAILRNWSQVLAKKDGLYLDAPDFAARLAANPGLRQVHSNALLLTMAVLFFKQRKRLPNDRWEFYVGAEQSLRDSWARHRLNDKDAASLPGDYAATVLESLALDGMQEGRVLFTAGGVAARVRAVLAGRNWTGGEQDAEAPRFLDAARDAIGVLVEQAPEQYGFVHLTFQEFLAARALVRRGEDAPAIIARFWDHPDWRETWMFYALGCQTLQGRFAELFDIVLRRERPHTLDAVLHRPERTALRLAGVGSERLPDTAEPALTWAASALARGSERDVGHVLEVLAGWERPLPDRLRDDVIGQLRRVHRDLHLLAVQALSARSDDAKVRAALLTACKDDYSVVRGAAVQALSARVNDAPVRAALLAAWKDTSMDVREAAVQALSARTDDPTVRAALLTAWNDERWDVRQAAVKALSARTDDANVRAALLVDCKRDRWAARRAAVQALSARADDATVRAVLLSACKDEHWEVRGAALHALSLRADDTTVGAALLAACEDEHWIVREAAVQALSARARDPTVRAALLAACKDHHTVVRGAAVQALSASADDATVRPALLAAFKDEHWDVRGAAVRSLSERSDVTTIRAALLTACKDERWDVRKAALKAISARTDDASVRAALLTACKDELCDVREAAVQALSARADDTRVCAALLAACKDNYSDVRGAAIQALSTRADVPTVRPALLAALEDNETAVRRAAVQALSGRPDDGAVRAALLAACKDEHPDVRRAAVQALPVRVDDAPVRAALLSAGNDENWDVRRAAMHALSACADDATVRAALLAALEDDETGVRRAAVQALEDWIVRLKFPRTASTPSGG